MSNKMKHPCSKIGCNNLTHDRYCEAHAKLKQRKLEQRVRDKERGSAVQRGYSYRWQQYSKRFLMQFPVCAKCGDTAVVTDHIVPHKGDMELFWDSNNHQPLCKRCHDRKTTVEDGGFGNLLDKP